MQYYAPFNFGCSTMGMDLNCLCRSDIYLSLMMDCLLSYTLSAKERKHAVRHIRRRCYDRLYHELDYTNEEMEAIWQLHPVSQQVPADPQANVTQPFHAQGEDFDFAFRSYKSIKRHTHNSDMLG